MIYTSDQITAVLVALREAELNPKVLSPDEATQFKHLLDSSEAQSCVNGSIEGMLDAVEAGSPSRRCMEATLFAMLHFGMQIGAALKEKELTDDTSHKYAN